MFTKEERLWGKRKNYYHVRVCFNCLARKGIVLIAPQDCPRLNKNVLRQNQSPDEKDPGYPKDLET